MPESFPIHVFEEQSSTLPIWWQHRPVPSTVVYLDAHLDLQQVGEPAIKALARCESVEQVRALEAPHHLNLSPRYAYGIENFLHPAARLGLLDRLIWVAPPHVPRDYDPALLQLIQQMDGIDFDELTGFARVGRRALRGRLLGIDITICDHDELAGLDVGSSYALDVDIDYFVVVPGDHPWIDPAVVIGGIVEQLGAPRLATVSRAVTSGFTPLPFRFVADYVAALLGADDVARDYHRPLFRALQCRHRGQAEQARALCARAVNAEPSRAAAHYLLSTLDDDPAAAAAHRTHAESLDGAYQIGLATEASAFSNRQLPLDRATLANLEARLDGPAAQGVDGIAVAKLLARAGMPEQSGRLFRNLSGELAGHGELALDIATGLLSRDRPREALGFLEAAKSCHKTRTGALLHLGDIALRSGDPGAALSRYEEAARRAPAWLVPLERRRLCHEIRNERSKALELNHLIEHRKRILEKLVNSSAGAARAPGRDPD